jgi:predicted DNA-binding transcriptional regulator AlpA
MIDRISDGFDPNERGISDVEAAEILGVEKNTLATWRTKGQGPRFRKIGRRVEYTPRFIREYQQSCNREPKSAAARRRAS